jgi:hypothetical protein
MFVRLTLGNHSRRSSAAIDKMEWIMTRNSRRSMIAALSAFSFMSGLPASASASSLDLLPGRWTGFGKVQMSSGAAERMKCVATYFLKNGGQQLNHNLRCASTSYRLDATADLNVKGSRLSGEWRERTYSTGGTVTGSVNDKGIGATIRGADFFANMKVVTTSRCRQTITLSPEQGTEIVELSISLARGC